MSKMRGLNVRERAAVALAAITLAVTLATTLAAGPSRASTPEVFCRHANSRDHGGDALASAGLTRAAAAAEARLARANALGADADDALALLDVPVAADAAPGPGALAAYCAAAGERERVGRSGNPPRARAYLTVAFADAESAHDLDDAARSAFRLGLLSSAATASANGRGPSSRAGPGGEAPIGGARDEGSLGPSVGEDACAALKTLATSRMTALALECAVTRAAAAGDPRLASLASLRLARLRLVAAEDSARRGFAPGDVSRRGGPRRGGARGAASIETSLAVTQSLALEPSVLRELAATAALSGLTWAPETPDAADRVDLTGRLVEVAIDAGHARDPGLPRATDQMRAALPADPSALAYAAALSGRIAMASGEPARARALFERAIFYESQAARPTRLADWYLLMAQAAPDQRAKYAHDAYLALESVRPFLPPRDPFTEEPTFELHMRAVFEAAADAQLSWDGPGERPGAIAAAQRIVEASREAEIQSSFGSECIPPTPPIRVSALRKGEIILYPVLLENRVELLYAVGGGDGAFHRLAPNTSTNRDAVAGLVERVHASTAHDNELWREPSRQLYDLLIAPIESRLTPDATLVIMPDGPLRALPFAALVDGQGKFLIERTRLSLAPALSYAQPGLDRAGRRATVVAAALEHEVVLPVGTFPKLDGTGNEARAATAGTGGEHRNILLEKFTRASLTDALERVRPNVLHLATHADFNGRSDRSYIVADGEAIPLADLRGMIAQSRARGDALDLLVLSACETAVGDDQASMGLAGAAVQAGARSAIASLWQVNDASTADLMKAFYDAYRGGATKAEALRSAQIALLGGSYRDPYYWAAFTLIGGWR